MEGSNSRQGSRPGTWAGTPAGCSAMRGFRVARVAKPSSDRSWSGHGTDGEPVSNSRVWFLNGSIDAWRESGGFGRHAEVCRAVPGKGLEPVPGRSRFLRGSRPYGSVNSRSFALHCERAPHMKSRTLGNFSRSRPPDADQRCPTRARQKSRSPWPGIVGGDSRRARMSTTGSKSREMQGGRRPPRSRTPGFGWMRSGILMRPVLFAGVAPTGRADTRGEAR